MCMLTRLALASTAALCLAAGAANAKPEIVQGPGYEPQCFKPWSAETKYFQ